MDSSRPHSHLIRIPSTTQGQGSFEEESSHSNDNPGSSEEESLLSSIEAKLEVFCSSITIFKAPNGISNEDRNVFIPSKVSIGPFHHGAPHLESMENLKWSYLYAFLKHNSSLTLDDLLELVMKSESRLRKCYEKKFYDINGDKFAQIMLLDCCFVLELLLRYSKKRLRRRNDPVFTTPGLLFDLRCDLMLLENQIPYFLLKDVYENVQDPLEENMYLNDLTFRFFKTIIAGERQLVYDNFAVDADHLLEMVHSCFLSTYPRIETNKSELRELPSATKLKTAGIKFKSARSLKSVLDIKFQSGVLEIPNFKVYKQTEAILKNLIAYEIRQIGSAQQVKSYVNFMSHLLQSDEDVKMLCGRKILSGLEDDEEQIISNLKWIRAQKGSLTGTYFAAVAQKLNKGPDKCAARWRRLRRNPVAIGVATVWVVIVIFVMAFFSAFAVLQRRYK